MAECDKPLFQTALTVQVGDVNYGGHLANDAVLRLCHEVRIRWLAALGWSEMDAGGAGLILAQGHHGDELSVEMGVAGVAGVGFSLLYRIRRISDGLVLAKVQTGMVCFDYGKQRVCRLPSALKAALEAV